MTDLSEESTPEEILMARELPCTIYSGKMCCFVSFISVVSAKVLWWLFEGASIRSARYFFVGLAII
jgi:hypothetical protein